VEVTSKVNLKNKNLTNECYVSAANLFNPKKKIKTKQLSSIGCTTEKEDELAKISKE
jgi:hypothetical protein